MLAGAVIAAAAWIGVDVSIGLPVAALVALTTVPICAAVLDREIDPFSPLQFAAGYFFLAYAARATYLALSGEVARIGFLYYEDYLPSAAWTAVAAFAAFAAGYSVVRSDRPSRRVLVLLPSLADGTPVLVPYVLLAVGSFSFARMAIGYGTVAGRDQNMLRGLAENPVPGWMPALSSLIPIAFGISVCCSFNMRLPQRRRRAAIMCAVACAVAIAVSAAVIGGKELILLPLGLLLLCYHYQRRRVRAVRAGLVVLAAVIILFPLFNITRSRLIPEAGGFPRSLGEAGIVASYTVEYFRSLTPEEFMLQGAGGLLDRSAGVDALSLVMKYTPEVSPYALGKGYLILPLISLVPRALWDSKPVIDGSGDFERTYMNMKIITQASPHLIADFYRNFGLAGVVLGAFFVGACFKKLYATFAIAGVSRPECSLWYAYLLLNCVHWLEVDFVMYACLLIRTVAVLFIATWFAARMRRAPAHVV